MLTVGQMLREERQKKGLILAQVEAKIRVRDKFLRYIEQDDWSHFSSKIYIVGIIKTYAQFLGLDHKKMLAFFRRDYEKTEEVRFKKKVSPTSLTPETKKYAKVALFVLCIIFMGYFGFQLKLFFTPPDVKILSPKERTFVRTDKIHIIGKTDKEASISIFGERVFQNKDGVFEYDFPLTGKENKLVIEVTGANGKKTVFTRTFMKEQ